MKYCVIVFVLLISSGCGTTNKVAQVEPSDSETKTINNDTEDAKDDSLEKEIPSPKTDLEGIWEMISIGDRILNEDENGSISFNYYENKHPELRNAIGASVGCNSLSLGAVIEKNTIRYTYMSMTEMYCIHLHELEKEMKSYLYKSKQFKLENNSLLILMDTENKITFLLRRHVENSQ